MTMQNLLHNAGRLFFLGASATIVLAFMEGVAQIFGISLIAEAYPPGRLLELAATLLIFVIAVLLREIRDTLRANQS